MVCPDNQAQEANHHTRIRDRTVPKNWLAAMDGNYFRNHPKEGQDHDVYRWVRIEPEHMLINYWFPTTNWIEKSRASN